MRAVIQRVTHAKVTINGKINGEIGPGLMILLGVGEKDTEKEASYLAEKCTNLRIFTDNKDKMNLSIRDISGKMLVVSQFTLYGNCRRGNRPSFTEAARPETAIPCYEAFIKALRGKGIQVETGIFGADMQVSIENDGPVTIWMDTDQMLSTK